MSNYGKLIEEMKAVIMEMYRSAGNLDLIIRDLEKYENEYEKKEMLEWLAAATGSFKGQREEYAKLRGWDNLNQKEKEIWQGLIEAAREKGQ